MRPEPLARDAIVVADAFRPRCDPESDAELVVAGSARPRKLRRRLGPGSRDVSTSSSAAASSACSFRARFSSGEVSGKSSSSLSSTSLLRLEFMEKTLLRSARLAGALAAGKCTSILFSCLVEDGWGSSVGAGVPTLLVRGVVYSLPDEYAVGVCTVDESEPSADALPRRRTEAAASNSGAAAYIRVSIALDFRDMYTLASSIEIYGQISRAADQRAGREIRGGDTYRQSRRLPPTF